MKNIILLFFFFSLGITRLEAQCYTDGVTFTTQEEIDAFHQNNPNCTKIIGDVIINGNGITNLDSLKYVSEFGGALIIQSNPSLTTLNGLHNTTEIAGDLKIKTNNSLTTLSSLSSLTSVGYNVEVILNPKLINLTGLEGLSIINSHLIIDANIKLQNLNGLNNIQSIYRSVHFQDNPKLLNISALSNVSSIGDSLKLERLPKLTSLQDFSNISEIGGQINIIETGLLSLDGLEQLTVIQGYLNLRDNIELASIQALSNVEEIQGNISIYNTGLTNLVGLEKITNVYGWLEINNNSKLLNLEGLNNVKSVQDFLNIQKSPELTDISALMNIDSVFGFFVRIYDNPKLESLSGIDNIFYIKGGSLSIHDNFNLTTCGIPSVCYHMTYGEYISIYSNAPGCNSISEVENTCGGSILQGFVFADNNNNCQFDAGDGPLSNWPIIAIQGTDTLIDYSDEQGIYKIFAKAGTYQIHAIPPNYWTETCTGTMEVTLGENTVEYLNFYGQEEVACTAMQIDISTSNVDACENVIFYVDYCNHGTIQATGAYANIHFGKDITIDSSELTFSDLGDNEFQFPVGNLKVNDCNQFLVYGHLSCDVIENQAVCAYAKIFPDEICNPLDPNWDGASLKITGSCTDSIRFKIENIGTGPMAPQVYDFVIEDWVILRTEMSISPGEHIDLNYPKDGQTYMVRTDQVPFHPGKSNPLVSIEGCTNKPIFSTGYMLQFPEDDANTFVSTDCQEASNDDGQANFPKGYSEEHYIEREQDIEYITFFQNTQNDSIQNIIIKEVISPYMDLTTLKLGASSHPYSMKIIEDTLILHFSRIDLPHSELSPVKSKGFVKFRISQKPNLANGTVIKNKAFIYYGVLPAIETNDVFNTIEDNFVRVDIDPNNQFKITAAPNPFTTHTTLKIEGAKFESAQFILFDQAGVQVLRKEMFYNDSLDLRREDLPSGTYPMQIVIDNKTITSGQLIVF